MNPEFRSIALNMLFLLTLVPSISCFQPSQNRVLVHSLTTTRASFNPAFASIKSFGVGSLSRSHLQAAPIEDNDDLGSTGSAAGESYQGDIDWDAEWKKVVEKRDQPSERPGKYKNDVERALLQTSKATSEQIKKVKIVKPDINMRSLQGDPKVCVCMCVVFFVMYQGEMFSYFHVSMF